MMSGAENAASRARASVDGSAAAWWEELRKAVLPALIGEGALWLSLVESGAEPRGPDFADGTLKLDVLEAANPESWPSQIAAPRSLVVDLLSLRTATKYAASFVEAARE